MATTKTANGIRLELDPEVMSENILKAIKGGRYEKAEAREIPRIVQPGERIVELGAGLGFIGLTCKATGLVQHYRGFEANPKLLPLIQRNAALNDAVLEVENAVVMPKPPGPTVPFYVRKDFWASSLAPQPWGYVEKVEVPTLAWQKMLDEHRPTMLVVDIEGGELALFEDAPLTGVKKIYMELHQKVIGRIGMKRVFDFMSARDFHYDQHHSHGGVVLFSHVLR